MPSNTNFIDYVKVLARSGKGGAGSLHFFRGKYIPKGGPDGGDGGRGGHVILRGNRHMWTLLPLRYARHIFAGNGGKGGENRCFGADGQDVYVDVPMGTVVYDAVTGEHLAQVTGDGQEIILLRGGRGGLGNWHFKSATNQTPRYAQPGEPAEERQLIFELKVLADVGLVGFPNAGKSTLLSVVSAAKPKIADYPFTTMEPQLGIVDWRGKGSFVMADIPGIIEGAAEGRGLGLRFLRHIERNAVLLFMVPADANDITAEYEVLLGELAKYNPQLLDKPRLLAVTKCDMLDAQMLDEMRTQGHLPQGIDTLFISSVTGQGIPELKDALWQAVNSEEASVNPVDLSAPLDVRHRQADEDDLDVTEKEVTDADDPETAPDLQNISREEWERRYAFVDDAASLNQDLDYEGDMGQLAAEDDLPPAK